MLRGVRWWTEKITRDEIMNHGTVIFLGSLLALAVSWYGMVIGPVLQMGNDKQVLMETTGSYYPSFRSGLAQQGREVYRANGCNYCHTQQVRPAGYGSDAARGWGNRPSVGRDYLNELPVMLGSQRIGQDLFNISKRQTNALWHFVHLYNPQSVSTGSVMPPYRYLFEKRKLAPNSIPSADALVFDQKAAVEAGYEVVPKREARSLVAYLMSLEAEMPLFEAPLPLLPKLPRQSKTCRLVARSARLLVGHLSPRNKNLSFVLGLARIQFCERGKRFIYPRVKATRMAIQVKLPPIDG